MLNYTKAFSGLAVDDLPRAREFYGETLGLKATVLDEEHHLLNLELADGRAVLVYGKPDHQPANFTILNFQVDDIDQAVDGLAAAGVEFERYDGGQESYWWLLAAEYIMSGGNYDVILCERGIRSFETYTRNTMDVSAIPVVKKLSHLPIVGDPSHGTGRRDMVLPMARAAVAAGADGLIVEVHPRPEEALSDGPQSLRLDRFATLMTDLQPLTQAVGRGL